MSPEERTDYDVGYRDGENSASFDLWHFLHEELDLGVDPDTPFGRFEAIRKLKTERDRYRGALREIATVEDTDAVSDSEDHRFWQGLEAQAVIARRALNDAIMRASKQGPGT